MSGKKDDIVPGIPGSPSGAMIKRWLNASITQICPCGYHDVSGNNNHCAHFVSHALGLRLGYTCEGQAKNKVAWKGMGVTVRVDDLFNRAPKETKGLWENIVNKTSPGLIYITVPTNYIGIENRLRTNKENGFSPKRHVGIYISDLVIYHFSNSKDHVVLQSLPDFKNHYSGSTILLYSSIPPANSAVKVSPPQEHKEAIDPTRTA